MNLAKIILLGRVSKKPGYSSVSKDLVTFELEVEEENKKFISTFNILCSGELSEYVISNIDIDLHLFVEGLIRGQALRRKKVNNQTLIVFFAKNIKILRDN